MPFHKEVQRIMDALPNSGLSKEDFQYILSQFVSQLRDGHTYLIDENDHKNSIDKVLNLQLKIVVDGLIVSHSENKAYNGLKLFSINGVTINELLDKIQFVKPCENRSGAYLSLIKLLNFKGSAERLLGDIKNNMIHICFFDANNQSIVGDITTLASPFRYEYIDDDKKIVCFRYFQLIQGK